MALWYRYEAKRLRPKPTENCQGTTEMGRFFHLQCGENSRSAMAGCLSCCISQNIFDLLHSFFIRKYRCQKRFF